MKKPFKLSKCTVGRAADVFLRDQLKALDYDFDAAMAEAGPTEQAAFQHFAAAFGCFSREKMVDDYGKPTPTVMGQLASAVLRRLMQDDGTQAKGYQNARLRIGDFTELTKMLPKEAQPDQDFINHLRYSYCDENGITRYPNFESLLNLERGYTENLYPEVDGGPVQQHKPRPGIFAMVMSDFPTAQNFRVSLNRLHNLKTLPHEEAFRKFYDYPYNAGYRYFKGKNRALAVMCQKHGLSQQFYDVAALVFDEAAKKHAPHHILGKPLTEPQGTQYFTYEMLDKYDPLNAILGLYTSCCAILGNMFYGSSIAEVAITERDVQNMVVRNSRGRIIAKGALYLNARNSEAVFNGFEINQDYKKGGTKGQALQREILATFQRGALAVVERFNKLHPKQPLRLITMGYDDKMHYPWFNLPEVKSSRRVNTNYYFSDSNTGKQYILYQSEQEKIAQAQPEMDYEPEREL